MQVLNNHGNQNLIHSVQHSTLEYQVLESALKIAQALDINGILNTAAHALQNLLKADRVVICQQDEIGYGIIIAESIGSNLQALLGTKFNDLSDLICVEDRCVNRSYDLKFQDSDGEIESPLSDQTDCDSLRLAQQQIKSSFVIPLVIDSQNWGAIVAHHCTHFHDWDTAEIESCKLLAGHLAIALQRALQIQHQQQVISDLQRSEQSLQEKTYQFKSLVNQQNFSTLQANAQLKNKIIELEQTNDSLALQTAKSNTLADFILNIRRSLELEQILDVTTTEIQRCLQVDRLVVCRIDAHKIGTIIAESVLAPWPSLMGVKFSTELFSATCQQSLSEMPYRAVADVAVTYGNTVPQMVKVLGDWGVKATVVVPILQETGLWGFMIAHQCRDMRDWMPAELELLTQVAAHVSISIEQAELQKRRQQTLEVCDRTEQLMMVQHEQINYVLASSPGILYSSVAQGTYQRIFFGTNLFQLLGYGSLDSIEPDFWANCIHPDDRSSVQLLSDLPLISQEYRFRHKDGSYRWLYDQQKVVYDDAGKPLEWIGYCVDISDRKQIEEKLKSSLAEKEILLQEIHHRVKNNLNIIISLLNLQSSYVTDDAIIDMFTDSQSRIRTMALIHEQLYGSENLARLNFADYVGDLVHHLEMACQTATDNAVELYVNIAPVSLNLETATPCGLILNELITNAFKHAFIDGRSGKISITLTRHDHELHLVVQDNGMGFPPYLDWQNSPTLGLRLVRILARQLDATLTQNSSQKSGTYFCLKLSELAYESRL
jgi:PAS domain S-box-containing protein